MPHNLPDIGSVLDLHFTHAATGETYGGIRRTDDQWPALPNGYTPIAEDECGNAFLMAADRSIHFWDHETDELVKLANDWPAFKAGCHEPEPVELDPSQVKSAWIDPEFAKEMGINAPPDGWIKKKE